MRLAALHNWEKTTADISTKFRDEKQVPLAAKLVHKPSDRERVCKGGERDIYRGPLKSWRKSGGGEEEGRLTRLALKKRDRMN